MSFVFLLVCLQSAWKAVQRKRIWRCQLTAEHKPAVCPGGPETLLPAEAGRKSSLCTQLWWVHTLNTVFSFQASTTRKILRPWSVSREGQESRWGAWSTSPEGRGAAKGTGIVHSGEGEAQGRPHCCLQVPERRLWWGACHPLLPGNSDRMTKNGLKLLQGRFRLDIRKHFLSKSAVRHRSHHLHVFKSLVDVAMRDVVSGHSVMGRWSFCSSAASVILWLSHLSEAPSWSPGRQCCRLSHLSARRLDTNSWGFAVLPSAREEEPGLNSLPWGRKKDENWILSQEKSLYVSPVLNGGQKCLQAYGARRKVCFSLHMPYKGNKLHEQVAEHSLQERRWATFAFPPRIATEKTISKISQYSCIPNGESLHLVFHLVIVSILSCSSFPIGNPKLAFRNYRTKIVVGFFCYGLWIDCVGVCKLLYLFNIFLLCVFK